jgi:nucleolysin TIA-1/TIAR
VTEELLMALFTQMGQCKNCKIIHEVKHRSLERPVTLEHSL